MFYPFPTRWGFNVEPLGIAIFGVLSDSINIPFNKSFWGSRALFTKRVLAAGGV